MEVPHPDNTPMKTILILPLFGLVLFTASCRTETPIDPMSMQPSVHCLPHGSATTTVVTRTHK
jgi:hypothetical protein